MLTNRASLLLIVPAQSPAGSALMMRHREKQITAAKREMGLS